MKEFFKPWRRKIGVVTLVVACVLMVWWVRSVSISDQANFHIDNADLFIVSFDGTFRLFVHIDEFKDADYGVKPGELPFVDWRPIVVDPSKKLETFVWRSEWKWQSRVIPFWSIVIPLTILSAWLLLSKPRRSRIKSAEASEPAV
jgi:hypothetical protein